MVHLSGRTGGKAVFNTRALKFLLDGFFPSECPRCGRSSDSPRHAPLCLECWGSITPYAGPSCDICGEPLVSGHSSVCGECLADRPAFSKVHAYGLFDGALKEAIHSYKFASIRRLAAPLAALLAEKCLGLPAADVVTAVPLTKKRLLERGFNQSMLIGREVARMTGAKLLPHALRKVKDTPAQAGLNRKERGLNLKGAFLCAGGVSGQTVTLVDDVITTGATARECSRALIEAGAREVYVVALARTKK